MKKLLNVRFFVIFSFIFGFMLSHQQRIFAEQLYRAEAVASYYAEKYHGRKTANGEIFNMNAMTCAHKTLPFNTVLRVTNLANGKNVQVRVNDRGPFVNGREIDLSKGAAIKLDMMTSGTARVKIEIVKEGNGARVSSNSSGTGKKKSAKINNAGSASHSKMIYEIQLGAFGDKDNAAAYAKKASSAGFKDLYIVKAGKINRVVIKNVPGDEVDSLVVKLNKNGFVNTLVKKQ